VEGRYSGILEPEVHYIPLKRDLSNIREALERLRDEPRLAEMAERAYQDVYLSGRFTYGRFARLIEQALFGESAPEGAMAVDRAWGMEGNHMDRSPDSLERQLVAERHTAALREMQLVETRQSLGDLQGRLVATEGALQAEREAGAARHAQLADELGHLRAALRIRRRVLFLLLFAASFAGGVVIGAIARMLGAATP